MLDLTCQKCGALNPSSKNNCINCNALLDIDYKTETEPGSIPFLSKNKILIFTFLFIAFAILITGIRKSYFTQIPNMSLKTNKGTTLSLRDLKGREIGVLIYYSDTPCQGHKTCTEPNISVYNRLAESKI